MTMTVRQKQLLLAYLGYYTGGIDGIWGARSKAATEAFQRAHMDSADGIFGADTEERIRQVIGAGAGENTEEGNFWKEIRYFIPSEFACRCGRCGGFPAEPVEVLVRAAEAVRQHYGAAVTVSSGVRCATHNAAVGGVANSRHLLGKAMDFRVSGQHAREVLNHVQGMPEIRYAYAIDENYVHMDVN